MSNNHRFCCENMNDYIVGKRAINYEAITRYYTTPLVDKTTQRIWYCPWCGKKLPKDLDDEWFDTLINECGIPPEVVNDYGIEPEAEDKIPEEFKTDEWWKKRGL